MSGAPEVLFLADRAERDSIHGCWVLHYGRSIQGNCLLLGRRETAADRYLHPTQYRSAAMGYNMQDFWVRCRLLRPCTTQTTSRDPRRGLPCIGIFLEALLDAPDRARVVGVIIARAVLDLAVQALDAAAHGMRVVDVDVVVLPADGLLHKGLLYLHPCMPRCTQISKYSSCKGARMT